MITGSINFFLTYHLSKYHGAMYISLLPWILHRSGWWHTFVQLIFLCLKMAAKEDSEEENEFFSQKHEKYSIMI